MDFASANLDHAADRDGLITPEVEDSLQHEVGVQSRGLKCGRVAAL
jgi:hypothetical protein